MNLRNPFTTDTRWLFHDVQYQCFMCGKNGQDCGGTELHHIIGRESNSPYNAAVMCKKCHAEVKHNDDEEKYLIGKTMAYLNKILYKPTPSDMEFLRTYAK